MIEEWKCIKEYKSPICNKNSYHIPNDKIYISNTGKVRLNDEELSFGHGLYIDDKLNVRIFGCSWPEITMHRTIYKLFIGEPHRDMYHNIHHKDFNHLNNHVDNLIELTAKEHGDIHKGVYDKDVKEYIQSLIEQKTFFIEQTKEWLKKRVLTYLENNRIEYNKKIEKQKEETLSKEKLRNEQIREEKIKSGNYTICSNGRLVPKTNKRKGYKMPDIVKKKISIGVTKAFEENPELRLLCPHNKGKKGKRDGNGKLFYD